MYEMKEDISEDISMENVLGKPLEELDPVEQAEREHQNVEYARLANEKVLFRGVERNRGDFCIFADEPLGDNPELSYSGFTEEEAKRARELAKPFNDIRVEDDENSMSMFAKWMDKNGFVFAVRDNFTDSIREIVPEKYLGKFLQKSCQNESST